MEARLDFSAPPGPHPHSPTLNNSVRAQCYHSTGRLSIPVWTGLKGRKENHVWVTGQPEENYRTANVSLVIS